MKPKSFLRNSLCIASSTLLAISYAQGAYYYWDTNGNTAGLGDAAGTWGTNAFHALVNAPNGRGVVGGTIAPVATATTGVDTMNFGTINLGLGSTASTIGILAGGVIINNITFGFGQANPVTLSGGGGSITLAGTTPTIFVNSTPVPTIGAELTGTAGMTKAGPSTLTLTGANTYTGTTSITGGGTLNVGNGTNGNLNNTTPTALTFSSGGGTFNVAQADTSSQGMGALTFTAGDGTVRSTAASGSATQTVTFASLAVRSLGATGNFSLATNTAAASNKIVLTSTTNAPLDSGSNNAGLYFGATEYARYDSVNGYFRAAIYGTDTNAPAPLSGTDLGAVTSVTDVKLNGAVTAQTTGVVNTIHLDGNTLTLQDNVQVLDVNGILSNGGSIAAAGALQGTTAGGEIVFNVTGGNLSAAPTIQDSRLTKTGAGTLTLSGTNTYTGITNINAGTLAVSGGSAIADTAAIVLANAAGATFQLNASETIGNLSGGGFSGGVVDVQGNTLTFGDSGNQLFGGTFTGTAGGAIVKQGSGTLSLSKVNAFPGTINLNAGALTFTLGNSGTTSAQSLSSGGAINMADTTTMIFLPTNQVALGQHTANSPSQLTAPNGWTIDNPIVITSGTASFRFYQNGSRWNFTGGVTGGTSGSQTLNILQGTPTGGGGDSQDILFSGVIQNGVGGTLGVNADFTASSGLAQTAFINLSGQNTFTGPLTVANTRGMTNGAFLTIGGERTNNTTGITAGAGSLGTTSPGTGNYTNTISLATGNILNYASSANQTLAGVISGTGAILKEGIGTLTLSGDNSINFVLPGAGVPAVTTGVTIRAGTLLVNNTTGSGTGSSNVGVTAGTLGGTGSISGTVTIGNSAGTADSILAPGNISIDSIATGNLTFNSDGRYAVELDGTLATSDQTLVTGTVAINATTSLAPTVTGTLSAGQKFFIVVNDDVDAVTGTFATLGQGAVVGNYGGTDLKISYTGDSGTNGISGGNDIVLYTEASGTPYTNWAGSEPFDGDANGDGVSNGLAFLLGAASPNVSALNKLPGVSQTSGGLVLTFSMLNAASRGTASLSVQHSSDLGLSDVWTTVLVPETAGISGPTDGVTFNVTLGSPSNSVIATISSSESAAGKLFGRLKATE